MTNSQIIDVENDLRRDLLQTWSQATEIIAKAKKKIITVLKLNGLSSTDLAGLDIGLTSLKVIKLNSRLNPPQVENFATSVLPENIIVKDEIKDPSALSEAIKSLFKQAGIGSKDVALAIPHSKTIVKNIQVDKRLTTEEIESRAWIEANRHFPDLVGDIYLDFFVSGVDVNDHSQLNMTLVACRKSQIKPYLDMLRMAGLQAKSIDVDSYALERALNLMLPKTTSTIGLLNINMNMSTLIVVQSENLIYAHDHAYDGQRLKIQTTNYIKNLTTSELDMHDALASDAAYQAILKENLLSHLRHSMQFFNTSRPNVGMQALIVSGDCATIPTIASFIQQEIGIETLVADPSSKLSFAESVNSTLFKAQAPTLVLACGLALTDGALT